MSHMHARGGIARVDGSGGGGRRERCINTCLALALVIGLSVFFFVPRPGSLRSRVESLRQASGSKAAASRLPHTSAAGTTTYAMASVDVKAEGYVDHLPISFESLYAPDDCGDVCYRGDTVLLHYTERRGDPKSPPIASSHRDGGKPLELVVGSKGWTAGVEGMCRNMKR